MHARRSDAPSDSRPRAVAPAKVVAPVNTAPVKSASTRVQPVASKSTSRGTGQVQRVPRGHCAASSARRCRVRTRCAVRRTSVSRGVVVRRRHPQVRAEHRHDRRPLRRVVLARAAPARAGRPGVPPRCRCRAARRPGCRARSADARRRRARPPRPAGPGAAGRPRPPPRRVPAPGRGGPGPGRRRVSWCRCARSAIHCRRAASSSASPPPVPATTVSPVRMASMRSVARVSGWAGPVGLGEQQVQHQPAQRGGEQQADQDQPPRHHPQLARRWVRRQHGHQHAIRRPGVDPCHAVGRPTSGAMAANCRFTPPPEQRVTGA